MSGGLLAAILFVVIGVPVVGVFGVLMVQGARKYMAGAKTAEQRNTVGQIAKEAVRAWEASADEPLGRHLCASASRPVPMRTAQIAGRKYQSTAAEWKVDAERKAGFACLGFEMSIPQYYQYMYSADGVSFTATARGDLDGDGELSTTELGGRVVSGNLVVSPVVTETSPEE
jgi:type IV pilus assembly protein PilA